MVTSAGGYFLSKARPIRDKFSAGYWPSSQGKLRHGMHAVVGMKIYEIRFCRRAAFERAFLDVLSCAYVEDCVVDRSALRLRFRANGEPEVQQLFHRIKLEGELTPAGLDLPQGEG